MTTPLKPDHEKRPFRFKLEGPFLRVSTMLLITPISPNFKGLKCSVFGRFRALQSRNIYGTVTYRVAVECKDYKNPVTAEKIEAFRSTLLDIGNDIQGIFASRNGFQTGAINVAKTYGIQLMQIREPLESDWDGCIKDIYIKYILRSIINVRPILYVDLDWANANGVTAENLSSFHGRSDCTFVVANKGQTDERKDSLKTFIDKLPSRDEGKNLTHTEKFDNAFIEYDNISIKVRTIKFVYDVHFSYDQQHIDAMNLAKAVVNNVITGRSFLINIRNDVSELK